MSEQAAEAVPEGHPKVTLHDALTALYGATNWGPDVAGRDTVARYLTENAPVVDDDQGDDEDQGDEDQGDEADQPAPAAAPVKRSAAKTSRARKTTPAARR